MCEDTRRAFEDVAYFFGEIIEEVCQAFGCQVWRRGLLRMCNRHGRVMFLKS